MKTKNTKKIMTVSGEYSMRNFTIADIQSFKGKRQLTKTIPFSEEEAEAAEGEEGAEGAEATAAEGDKPAAEGDKKEGDDKKPADKKAPEEKK